ncbi:MAG: hypothetical protein IKF36_01925 [Bacilli bacterium]|nr:hypothetical protein [Bacilli bacterium]
MNKKSNFLKKRSFVIALFLLLIAGITLGYSALQTQLEINGNTTIDAVGWDIHFANVNVTQGSVAIGAGNQAATIDSEDTTKMSYNITLKNPGDFYEFTVDIVNAGTIDAKISEIVADQLTAAQDVYTNYTVTYTNNTIPAAEDKLAHGQTKTLKVRIEFDTDIDPDDLPTEGANLDLDYQILYVQDR